MALKININLTTTDGGIINSGSYVRFETVFPENGLEVHFNLRVYRNQQALVDGKKQVYPMELLNKFNIIKPLTSDDFENLTPLAVHILLKNELESVSEIGLNNVEIIL